MMSITLDQMTKGTKGKVVSITGGRGAMLKLAAQGIAPGMTIEKVGHLRGGPVLVKVGQSQVAIGRGLASKVVVRIITK